MGRELQKRKSRSGIAKATQNPKSKKRLLAHPVIAASWNKNETLAQNYKRLGLAVKLNKTTGGTEKKLSDILSRDEDQDDHDPLNITAASKRKKQQLNLGEAKIERDPKTGKILRIVDQASEKPNPLNDPLKDLDSESEDDVFSLENQHGNTNPAQVKAGAANARTETVRQLEEQASRPAAKYKRKQPEGEVKFIEELVRKYGYDYGKMARDMKINYMQRSEGDLKKRIKKWRENGGMVD